LRQGLRFFKLSILILISSTALFACSPLTTYTKTAGISKTEEAKIMGHLMSKAESIRITDPDPSPDYLIKYETLLNKQKGGQRIVQCNWQKEFSTNYCYYYHVLTKNQRRVFFFIMKNLNLVAEISSIELCVEETTEFTYFSPQCPLNLDH